MAMRSVTTTAKRATPSIRAASRMEPPRISPAASGCRAMPSLAAAPMRPMPMPAPTATIPAPMPAPHLARDRPAAAASSRGRNMSFFLSLWVSGDGWQPGSVLRVDGGVYEQDRELREDEGLQQGHEALDDHDEDGEAEAERRGAPGAGGTPLLAEEEDQAHEAQHHH